MSKTKENPNTVRARNAKPERKILRQEQGNVFLKQHPEKAKEYKQMAKERNGGHYPQGAYARMLDESMNPIIFDSDNVAVTADYHAPFYYEYLIEQLLDVPEKHGTRDLIMAGDTFDCDDYSSFLHVSPPECFVKECANVKDLLTRLLGVFENLYICKGNHCHRWISLNAGKMGMNELFALARPADMCENEWNERVHITTDDHIYFTQRGEKWLCCHPRNFRQTNLSVAKDLIAKYGCNVVVEHGHQLAQGFDRSGKYRALDGGGMFDREALSYLRATSCYPTTKSGFYVIKKGEVIVYEGK